MKPLCTLCSSRHESYQAHVFATNAVPAVVNRVVNKSKDRHKDKEGRKKYLREYMRKRRAAAKA